MQVAVLYRFEVWEGGERRLVTEEEVAASTRAMLAAQLTSVPQRPLLARGPGWFVFAGYQAARRAARALEETAASVELREVVSVDNPAADSAWVAADGVRFVPVAGGLVQRVK